MTTWRDILTYEKLPLNVQLVFHLQNDGLNMVLYNGEQLQLSKKSRRAFNDLLKKYRSASASGIDFSERMYPSPVKIDFHDGRPNGHQAGYKKFQDEVAHYHDDIFFEEYMESLLQDRR